MTYRAGIILSEVVDLIHELFEVLDKDKATLSARRFAVMKVEECILKLQNLKVYLKQSS